MTKSVIAIMEIVTSNAYRQPRNTPASIEAASTVSTFATLSKSSRPTTPTRTRRNARSSLVSFRNRERCIATYSPLLRRHESPQDRLSAAEDREIGRHRSIGDIDPELPVPVPITVVRTVDRGDKDRRQWRGGVGPFEPEKKTPGCLEKEQEHRVEIGRA